MPTRTPPSEFKRLLRKSGYKATPSRLAILAFLDASRDPLSAQHIIEAFKREMDQATVYRILRALKQKGLIYQIDLRHNHAHYEIARTKEHHHLSCIRCGRIEDVHECSVDDIQGNVLKHSKQFAEITQHALEFYGLCKACKRKNVV